MDANTTAIVTQICGTVITVATLVLGFLSQRKKSNSIHDIVNSTNNKLVTRNEQLTGALSAAKVPIPETPEEGNIS